MPIDWVVRRARVALVVVGGMLAVGAHMSTSAADVESAAPLIQAPGCEHPAPAPPDVPPAVIASDGTRAEAPMVLFIPPTVFVRVDEHGAPTGVMTNTGCAPRSSDHLLVEVDPTHATAAPPELVRAVRALPISGDWSQPGRWHRV